MTAYKPWVIKRNTQQSQHYTRLTTPSQRGSTKWLPPARTITVALDMSKAFDTVNIHTLIGKRLQTSIPGTILKFVANYIKGRKACTSFRNHKSIHRQVKNGVPQGGVISPTLFNIYTADIPTPTAPAQVMLYADDITITSTHTSMSAARKYIQPYLHNVYDWTCSYRHTCATPVVCSYNAWVVRATSKSR